MTFIRKLFSRAFGSQMTIERFLFEAPEKDQARVMRKVLRKVNLEQKEVVSTFNKTKLSTVVR